MVNTDNKFKVTIFGSARIKKDQKEYKQAYELAKTLGEKEFDVVTGGGPGIMEAGNEGHKQGDKENKSSSIGLTIQLPWENEANPSVEVEENFKNFSNRLDKFMALSDVVVVMPGGIGTCLELFFTWQLIQVKHIEPIPIIVVGEMWKKLMDWIKEYPLATGLISPEDMNSIHIAYTNEEIIEIIEKEIKK